MRVMHKHGNHVRNQTWKNLGLAVLCLLVSGGVFLLAVPKMEFLQLDLVEAILMVVSLGALVSFFVFMRRYRTYRGGLEGEQRVSKLLKAKLNNNYYLLNDVYFRGGGGDIDHIVLGPNGLFVVETKNWSGKISCLGDDWQRESRPSATGSPSKQVKRNASRVQKLLETTSKLKVWVEAVVVFTNPHADLHLSQPTVPILRLHELPSHISGFRNSGKFSHQQLEFMGKAILKQTR